MSKPLQSKTLTIVIDSRESLPLKFPSVLTCSVRRGALNVGDYACEYSDGIQDQTVFERKSVSDLFGSFVGDRYLKEKNKITRAKEQGKKYILTVEAPVRTVLKGYKYSRKPGMAMFRQLMTLMRRYGVEVWFCTDRREMALRIQEYFLSGLRTEN